MSDVRRTVWIVVTYAAIELPLYLPMSARLNKKVMGSPRPMFWGASPIGWLTSAGLWRYFLGYLTRRDLARRRVEEREERAWG